MSDEIETLAQAIHERNPVTLDGVALDWALVTRSHPARAAVYREAARNRIRANEAMRKLAAKLPKDRPRSVV